MNKQQITYVDNKPHIKCNVVILESEQDSKLQLQMNNRLHHENGNSIALKSYQHLYITSDKEIKEGDWSYNDVLKEIVQNNCSSNRLVSINTNEHNHKIIATTDISLTIKGEQEGENTWYNPLPQLSQQFIEKYIEEYNKGNQINTVLVEVEDNLPGHVDNRDGKFKTFGDLRAFYMILKVNPQNQITIRKQKDSWSREEVIDLCRSAYLYGEQGALKLHNGVFKEWIEENL